MVVQAVPPAGGDARVTPRGRKNYEYAPLAHELQMKDMARKVDFWREEAKKNLKRALNAEASLAQHEGPIG